MNKEHKTLEEEEAEEEKGARIHFYIGLAVLAIGIAVYAWFSHAKTVKEEKEAAVLVDDTISAISAKWDPKQFIARAEPGLIEAMRAQPGQSVEDLFRVYRKLGVPTEDANCVEKDLTRFQGVAESFTTVTFACGAQYEHGPASISITVRKGDAHNEWQIYYFHIDAPAFASDAPSDAQ